MPVRKKEAKINHSSFCSNPALYFPARYFPALYFSTHNPIAHLPLLERISDIEYSDFGFQIPDFRLQSQGNIPHRLPTTGRNFGLSRASHLSQRSYIFPSPFYPLGYFQ
jgi:hypothetical protein